MSEQVDPARPQAQVSVDAVEAALDAWFGPTWRERDEAETHKQCMSRALAAVDAARGPSDALARLADIAQLTKGWKGGFIAAQMRVIHDLATRPLTKA
jgi:hypothetical protein